MADYSEVDNRARTYRHSCEVHELEIFHAITFLNYLTLAPSERDRISPQKRTLMTFTNLTREMFEPYIVREVTKRLQEAKASMGDFISATYLE